MRSLSMAMSLVAIAVLLVPSQANVASDATPNTNPIHKVIGMLRDMQNELEREADSEKELFEKAMCACSDGEAHLKGVIVGATADIDRLEPKIQGETAEQTKVDQEVKAHEADKKATVSTIKTLVAQRKKENSQFMESDKMMKFSIGQLDQAIPMIEGSKSAAAFLQASRGASSLRRIISVTSYLDTRRKDAVLGFLEEGASGVSAGSQQIIGVLKAMRDEMAVDHKGMVKAEAGDQAFFVDLHEAKLEHLGVLIKTISDKNERSGALGVAISQDNRALGDAQTDLADGSKYLQSLQETCAQREKDRDLRRQTRTDEISAISQAIEILSDGDARDTFQKSLRKPALIATSLSTKRAPGGVIMKMSKQLKKSKARHLLLAQTNALSRRPPGVQENADQATKVVGFMIDNMVHSLHEEDVSDEHKKEWCYNETQHMHQLQEDKEAFHQELEKQIAVLNSELEQLRAEIKELELRINTIDQDTADATEQRRGEHNEFAASYTAMSTAEQLIDKAANRLQQFYSPKAHAEKNRAMAGLTQTKYLLGSEDESAPEEETVDDKDTSNYGAAFVQMRTSVTIRPVEIPDTPKTYQKKESGGVVGLMAEMKADLVEDIREAEVEEKHGVIDYNRNMKEAKVSREAAVQSLHDKNAVKASKEEKLVQTEHLNKATVEEILAIEFYLKKVHIECDFLLRNFEAHHDSRVADEVGLEGAETIVTKGEPPNHQNTEKEYKEEHTDAEVDSHFPEGDMPLPEGHPKAE